MNRSVTGAFVLAVLAIATVSCSKGPSTSGAASAPPESAKTAAPEAARPLDPKALITDDKIGRFIVYQKEMNSVADLAMSVGAEALKNGVGSKEEMEKALANDDRAKKLASAQASALAQSGLTQVEANEIVNLLSPYIAGFTIGDEEMKQKARDEMKAQFGPEAVAVFEKRLPELAKLQEELMERALGKRK